MRRGCLFFKISGVQKKIEWKPRVRKKFFCGRAEWSRGGSCEKPYFIRKIEEKEQNRKRLFSSGTSIDSGWKTNEEKKEDAL